VAFGLEHMQVAPQRLLCDNGGLSARPFIGHEPKNQDSRKLNLLVMRDQGRNMGRTVEVQVHLAYPDSQVRACARQPNQTGTHVYPLVQGTRARIVRYQYLAPVADRF
jgi:hypothetical protein